MTVEIIDMRPVSRRVALGAMLGAAASVGGCASFSASRMRRLGAPSLPREFRAAWVATVDNIDWPSEPGLSEWEQRREIERILDVAAAAHLNAIFLQVRPTADALYPSRTEPWSAFLSGAQGEGPSYDPLRVWIDGAHARGIDLHAWVNPFRARHVVSIGPDVAQHVVIRRPDLVRSYGPYLWLDPGEPEARDLALRVTGELLGRYDIDGVHMDDYFYPYPRDDAQFPDDASYQRFRRGGGQLDRSSWRRQNIDMFVQAMYELTHAARRGAVFTISPFGIWRPEHPPGIRGFDAFEGLAADSRRWLAEGWCDALLPQLYWKISSEGQPFVPLLEWWLSQRGRAARHVWPGLYLTRIKPEGDDSPSWEAPEIVAQIEETRTRVAQPGYALFSMVGLLQNRRGVTDQLKERVLQAPALAPVSPWAGGRAPGTPHVRRLHDGRIWCAHEGRQLAVRSQRADGSWATVIRPSSGGDLVTARGGRRVIINAVGLNGLTSDDVVISQSGDQ
ncbi:MAG: family 10 glycosylhydrolase [Planctomycetota bacterium]